MNVHPLTNWQATPWWLIYRGFKRRQVVQVGKLDDQTALVAGPYWEYRFA